MHPHTTTTNPQYASNFLDAYQHRAECAYTGAGMAPPPAMLSMPQVGGGGGAMATVVAEEDAAATYARPPPSTQGGGHGFGLAPPPPAPRPPAEAPNASRQWFVTNDHADTRAMMANNNVIPPPENKDALEKTRFAFVVVDSASRNHDDYPEPNKYRIPLANEIRDVKSLQLVSYKVPTPQFPVRTCNNTLHLTNAAPTVTEDGKGGYTIDDHKDTNQQSVALDPGYYGTDIFDHAGTGGAAAYVAGDLATYGITGLKQDALALALETKLNASTTATCVVHIEEHSNRYVLRTNFKADGAGGGDPVFFKAFFQGCTEFYDTFTTERVNVSGDDQNPVFQNKQYGKTEHKYLPGSLGPVIGHPRTDADTRLQGTVTSDGTTLTGVGTAFLSTLQKGDALYICELASNTKHVVTVSDTVESDTSVPIAGNGNAAFGDAYAWVGRISFPWVRNLQPDCYTVMRIRQCATLKSFTPALDRAFYMIPNTASDYSTIKPFLPIKYFSPTLGRLNELTIEFLNADGSPYDFMGRNHTLLFRVEHHRQNVNYGDF